MKMNYSLWGTRDPNRLFFLAVMYDICTTFFKRKLICQVLHRACTGQEFGISVCVNIFISEQKEAINIHIVNIVFSVWFPI